MSCPEWAPKTACDALEVLIDNVPGLGTAVDTVQAVEGAVSSAAETAAAARSWATDPFGSLAEAARSGAEGLITEALPWFVDALEPNLSADWFISMYVATFGLAVGVWVLILMWGLVSYGRNKQGPAETIDMLTSRSAAFLIGAMFGPAVGTFLIALIGALTKSVIRVFVGSSTDTILGRLESLAAEGSVDMVMGGSIVAAVVFCAMFVGLFFVILTLLVMLIALYFSGVVFPLGWVWITREKTSKKGMKILWVFVGILLAHPLLFLMLGVSLNLAASTIFGGTGEISGSSDAPTSLRYLVSILLAVLALWMTAMSPVMLAKFAPVLPTEGDIGGVGGADFKGGFSGSGGGGGSGSGLADLSQSSTTADSSSAGGGGDFGGNDLLQSRAAGGPGMTPNTADAAGGGDAAGAGSGMGTAAAEGAAAGAEEGAEAGAETGPGALVTAGIGAIAGATEAAVNEATTEATGEANQFASESAQSDTGPSGGQSGGGDAGGDSAESRGSSSSGSGDSGGGLGSLTTMMDNLSEDAVEQMDDYLDPDRFGR